MYLIYKNDEMATEEVFKTELEAFIWAAHNGLTEELVIGRNKMRRIKPNVQVVYVGKDPSLKSPCSSKDPELMCPACNCWKATRAACS